MATVMNVDDRPVEKKIKDFTSIVDEKLPEYVEPAKKDKAALPVALENLLALEKKTRLAADLESTKRLAVAIIALCKECGAWRDLCDHITLLCTRRAQLSKVVQLIIQTAFAYVEESPTKDDKMKLITTLRTVSEGKIFVELERARLTRTLAEITEAEGDLPKACKIAQEVSVETVGSMEVREKTEFLLYQVELCSKTKDFVRTELIAKKIKPKNLEPEDFQDLKVRYYDLMVGFYTQKKNMLQTSYSYEALFRTKSIQDDEKRWKEALSRSALYAALSLWDHDVSELVIRLKAEKLMNKLPSFKTLLTLLTTKEIIAWPLKQQADWGEQTAGIFEGEEGKERLEDLHKRIVQHNIRVVSGFYTRISAERLAELLQLPADQMERLLSEMVSAKQLYAKIDRCVGRITFQKKQAPAEVLTEWASDISQLLTVVEKTCHLINKENMVHGIA